MIGWVDMGGHHDVFGRGKQRTTAGYVEVRTLTDHDLIDNRQVEITQLIDLIDYSRVAECGPQYCDLMFGRFGFGSGSAGLRLCGCRTHAS